jgi:hypothetical protein
MSVILYLRRCRTDPRPAMNGDGDDGGGAFAFSITWGVGGGVDGVSQFSDILSVSE